MIIVRIQGGLGNQMFQYALGRSLSMRWNERLALDLMALDLPHLRTYRRYGLDAFGIDVSRATEDEVASVRDRPLSLLRRWRGKGPKRTRWYRKEKSRTFDPSILEHAPNAYLDGYWQNERYFKDIRGALVNEFRPVAPLDSRNEQLLAHIRESCSVSLHVRRGDYVTDSGSRSLHGLCSLEYYRRSIDYIQARVDDPSFFFFSDDGDWVVKNLPVEGRGTLVSGNDERPEVDLYLMSQCRHNIIANSSYSWWGGWLNGHDDKIVIAPMQWFRDEQANAEHEIVPEEWIRQ